MNQMKNKHIIHHHKLTALSQPCGYDIVYKLIHTNNIKALKALDPDSLSPFHSDSDKEHLLIIALRADYSSPKKLTFELFKLLIDHLQFDPFVELKIEGEPNATYMAFESFFDIWNPENLEEFKLFFNILTRCDHINDSLIKQANYLSLDYNDITFLQTIINTYKKTKKDTNLAL